MVAVPVLEAGVERRGGSNPLTRTKFSEVSSTVERQAYTLCKH